MKRYAFVLLFLLVAVFAVTGATAQDQDVQNVLNWQGDIESELESTYGAATIGSARDIEAATEDGCTFPTIELDSANAGLLTVNSQVVEVKRRWCPERHSELVAVGSNWPGYPGKTQQLYGFLVVRDANDKLLREPWVFNITNNPSVEGVLQWNMEIPLPLDGVEYRFEMEANVRMLPDNIGPGTFKAAWYKVAGTAQVGVHKSGWLGEPGNPVSFELLRLVGDQWVISQVYTIGPNDLVWNGQDWVAEFNFTGVVAPNSTTVINYRVRERVEDLPWWVTPQSGNTPHRDWEGFVDIYVDAQRHTQDTFFHNRANQTFLPILVVNTGNQCPWTARLSYQDQQEVLSFQPVSADLQTIGTLPYGENVRLEFFNGGGQPAQVEQIVVQSHVPGNPWEYDYRNETGPVVNYRGIFDWDNTVTLPSDTWKLHPGIEHNIIAEIRVANVRCLIGVNVTWDPPEGTAVAIARDAEGMLVTVPADHRHNLTFVVDQKLLLENNLTLTGQVIYQGAFLDSTRSSLHLVIQ